MNELLSEPWVISVVTSLVTALFLSVSKLIEIAFTEKRRIAAEFVARTHKGDADD